MKTNTIVTDADYRKAKFMINNIAIFAPAKSHAALVIMRSAEKIIMLYHMQKHNTTAKKPANSENIIGTTQQNTAIFFATRMNERKTK